MNIYKIEINLKSDGYNASYVGTGYVVAESYQEVLDQIPEDIDLKSIEFFSIVFDPKSEE